MLPMLMSWPRARREYRRATSSHCVGSTFFGVQINPLAGELSSLDVNTIPSLDVANTLAKCSYRGTWNAFDQSCTCWNQWMGADCSHHSASAYQLHVTGIDSPYGDANGVYSFTNFGNFGHMYYLNASATVMYQFRRLNYHQRQVFAWDFVRLETGEIRCSDVEAACPDHLLAHLSSLANRA